MMADQLAEPSYAPMDPAFAAPTAPSSDSGTHNSNPSMNKVTSSGAILTGGYNTVRFSLSLSLPQCQLSFPFPRTLSPAPPPPLFFSLPTFLLLVHRLVENLHWQSA